MKFNFQNIVRAFLDYNLPEKDQVEAIKLIFDNLQEKKSVKKVFEYVKSEWELEVENDEEIRSY